MAVLKYKDKDGNWVGIPTIKGEQGPKGDTGQQGETGNPGKSAYEYARDGNYTGTEEEFAQKLAQEIPQKTSQLENDSKYIKNTVTDLAYYYNKDTTYNRTEIDERISAIPKFERKVVDVLPEVGLPEVLYLLRIAQPDEENSNLFEEWIWENGWERLGYQTINLIDYALKTDVETTIQSTLQAIYPIGAIYISTVSTNPAAIFNFGEWEPIRDRFLLGAGSYSDSVGSEGGEASHTLTEAELPKVGGTLVFHGDTWATKLQEIKNIEGYTPLITSDDIHQGKIDVVNTKDEPSSQSIGSPEFKFGGNQPHNNMPPYLAVYMWKRMA